mmetsp:Transcript_1573/g.4945  ORF Transcript_1573/g.4945 Transcript_1573/m.4945 type:complete len:609 (+) Transcript_1573:277-2103(+)
MVLMRCTASSAMSRHSSCDRYMSLSGRLRRPPRPPARPAPRACIEAASMALRASRSRRSRSSAAARLASWPAARSSEERAHAAAQASTARRMSEPVSTRSPSMSSNRNHRARLSWSPGGPCTQAMRCPQSSSPTAAPPYASRASSPGCADGCASSGEAAPPPWAGTPMASKSLLRRTAASCTCGSTPAGPAAADPSGGVGPNPRAPWAKRCRMNLCTPKASAPASSSPLSTPSLSRSSLLKVMRVSRADLRAPIISRCASSIIASSPHSCNAASISVRSSCSRPGAAEGGLRGGLRATPRPRPAAPRPPMPPPLPRPRPAPRAWLAAPACPSPTGTCSTSSRAGTTRPSGEMATRPMISSSSSPALPRASAAALRSICETWRRRSSTSSKAVRASRTCCAAGWRARSGCCGAAPFKPSAPPSAACVSTPSHAATRAPTAGPSAPMTAWSCALLAAVSSAEGEGEDWAACGAEPSSPGSPADPMRSWASSASCEARRRLRPAERSALVVWFTSRTSAETAARVAWSMELKPSTSWRASACICRRCINSSRSSSADAICFSRSARRDSKSAVSRARLSRPAEGVPPEELRPPGERPRTLEALPACAPLRR